MSRRTAADLWGAAAVRHALADPDPDPVSAALVAEVARRADPPGAFRAWALTLQWPSFCAVVRIVAGETKREIMEGKKDGC